MAHAPSPAPTVRVSYPGRVCLLGEHCDWAGGASLAAQLGRRIRIVAEDGPPSGEVTATSAFEGHPLRGRWSVEGSVELAGGPLRFAPAVLHRFVAMGLRVPPTHLTISSDLPAGRGFSSSAAFTLALVDALARRAGCTLPTRELAVTAYEVEHDLLGVECGLLDPLACSARAPVLIRWGSDGAGAYDLSTLSPGRTFHLLVGAFSAPRDTGGILATLNADHRAGRPPTRAALATFAAMALEGAAALVAGDARALGAAMDRAQEAYEEHLAPSHAVLAAPRLVATCARLREAGAWGAKFSGAGGDGSVVALFDDEARARAAVEALGEERELQVWYEAVEAEARPAG